MVDLPFVRNDHAQRRGRLATFPSRLSQLFGDTEPDIVEFERPISDQDGVSESALTKQMHVCLHAK